MRSSLALIFASVISSAAAAGTLGFALGDKRSDGSCKGQDDYEADFKALAAQTDARIVRTYAAAECNSSMNILPAAKSSGFQVVLGVWPDSDESFALDKAALIEYAPKYKDQVYAITVGSESMYRGTFTGTELLTRIQEIKKAVPGFKIGTADSWNKFQDGTADAVIKGGVDILLCNAFSYWQGQVISNATGSFFDDIKQAFGHIQAVSGSNDAIEMWVGETGWTTAGSKYGDAVPSVSNAATFFKQGVCGLIEWGFNVFFFEAFDEPWKPVATGQDGTVADETHWGAMTVDRKAKYAIKC